MILRKKSSAQEYLEGEDDGLEHQDLPAVDVAASHLLKRKSPGNPGSSHEIYLKIQGVFCFRFP